MEIQITCKFKSTLFRTMTSTMMFLNVRLSKFTFHERSCWRRNRHLVAPFLNVRAAQVNYETNRSLFVSVRILQEINR